MTDVLIKRELLEDLRDAANDCLNHEIMRGNDRNVPAYTELVEQADAALSAPRQSEGDAISRERVQAEADAFFDWPTADKSSVTTTSCLIFARCIAGMVAADRDATIAELRDRLDTMRQQLAERDAIIERLETGIPRIQEQSHQMRQQRDKLAGLLRDALKLGELDRVLSLRTRALAALAEVKLCQESPHPAVT